jgi:hypothetical protein
MIDKIILILVVGIGLFLGRRVCQGAQTSTPNVFLAISVHPPQSTILNSVADRFYRDLDGDDDSTRFLRPWQSNRTAILEHLAS